MKFEEDGGHGWRERVGKYAEDHWYISVFDPTVFFDYEWSKSFQKSDHQIREYYFEAIKKSRLVLINLNNSDRSVGTGMEATYASCKGKTIIGFGTENVYNWVKDLCTVVFDDLETALEYITCYYTF